MDLPEQHNAVSRRLHGVGARYTSWRRAVVAALAHAAGPVTPADLHRRLEAVPLSSVYRSLGVLADAGVVTRSHDSQGVALVELDEWLAGHHHPLVCTSCGEVTDVDLPPETEARLERLAGEIAAHAGYRVTGHRMDIEGTCASCRR